MHPARFRWFIIFLLFATSIMGANAVYFAVNVDVAPKHAATAFGIMNLAFAISGFLAPVITGSVLKLHGSFVDAFWLMAALALLSVIVVLVFHDPDRDRQKQMPRAE